MDFCRRIANQAEAERAGWQKATPEDRQRVLERIVALGKSYPIADPNRVQVVRRGLPFHDTVTLLRARAPEWNPVQLALSFLDLNGTLYWLNGTSPPIHELNARAPVKINERNVLDHLRFFMFYVRGDEGPFYVAETVADPVIVKDDRVRRVIEGTIRPAMFEGTTDDGGFLCNAVVIYSNAIFISNLKVWPTGMIEMLR